MKKTSLADIASQLGVSKTLVSMVLNNKGDMHAISKETQKKVFETAKMMNYQPNQIARSLRIGKSKTIGLIVADISNAYYSKLSRSIEDNCSKAGYNLLICSTDETSSKEKALLAMLKNRQVDGIILSSTLRESNDIVDILYENYPLVLIDRFFPELDANTVLVKNYDSSKQAVLHLIEEGFKKIAHFTISPNYVSCIVERKNGYLHALLEKEMVASANIIEIPFNDVDAVVKAQIKNLCTGKTKKADAIFCANNNIALAVVTAAADLNLRIPEDIGLVSFDDVDIFKFINPAITAIRQPIEKICENAVAILVDTIEGNLNAKKHVFLDAELMVRGTSIRKIKKQK